MIGEYKGGLRKAGVKAPVVQAGEVNPDREFRRAFEERLKARLGLSGYDIPAPLDDALRECKKCRVMLSQHIGAPAKAVVAAGDMVKNGDLLAEAAEGLSGNIHAPIDGKVTEVTEKYILVEAD